MNTKLLEGAKAMEDQVPEGMEFTVVCVCVSMLENNLQKQILRRMLLMYFRTGWYIWKSCCIVKTQYNFQRFSAKGGCTLLGFEKCHPRCIKIVLGK